MSYPKILSTFAWIDSMPGAGGSFHCSVTFDQNPKEFQILEIKVNQYNTYTWCCGCLEPYKTIVTPNLTHQVNGVYEIRGNLIIMRYGETSSYNPIFVEMTMMYQGKKITLYSKNTEVSHVS